MSAPPAKIHPSDVGLPEPAVRKRRRSRRLARVMLTVAVLTAVAGWGLYYVSVFSAIKLQRQSPSLVFVAYGVLIVSSITLVLGLWYLLLAQVERLARIVDADELAADAPPADRRCGNCGWPSDPPDRFCRHCGRPIGASIRPEPPG
jgi:hypothetical protein